MRILYAVTTCSDKTYRRLFEHVPVKPAFQSQKYHRLLIEGLAARAKVDVIANPPVNRNVLSRGVVRLPREEEGGTSAGRRSPPARCAAGQESSPSSISRGRAPPPKR